MVALAAATELFHASDGSGYADLEIGGFRETTAIKSARFQNWLERQFYEETKSAPNSEAMKSALGTIEARARFDGPERTVHVRLSRLNDALYLDLGDATWAAIEIDSTGWRIVDRPPVRFLRPAGFKSLPRPAQGGSIKTLRRFLNVGSDSDFVLAVSWLLAFFQITGPFPILAVSGEQGSAKSTFERVLRSLVDPNSAPLRSFPKNERDLFIAAGNARVLVFDNLSNIPPWLSDTLCRLATGGGFATKKNYTDQEEVLINVERPILLNGIGDIVTRPDLADRAIFLNLKPITEGNRKPESELWAELESKRPGILGALLDAVVTGLKNLPAIGNSKLPRMADFAKWIMACETAFWPAGAFLAAYEENRLAATEDVLEADPLAVAVRTMMTVRTVWTGTASDLLKELGWTAYGTGSSPRAIAGRLRRVAADLRKVGIDVTFDRKGHSRTRTITITNTGAASTSTGPSASASTGPSPSPSPPPPPPPSSFFSSSSSSSSKNQAVTPSAPSASPSTSNTINGLSTITTRTVADTADGTKTNAGASTSSAAQSAAPPRHATADGTDGVPVPTDRADPDDDLRIPDFLDRSRNPRPGDVRPKQTLN